MPNVLTGPAQYLARFDNQSISCNPYALTKLGIDRTNCYLKIEKYVILCAPYQLGFKRSIFMASLSMQELGFFQKYVNGLAVLSLTLNLEKRTAPVKFYIHCTLKTIGQMKGQENVGLLILDIKSCPDEMVSVMGRFMENQERTKTQYDDYGKSTIRMTPDTAKAMGYNLYATITGSNPDVTRIQIYSISSKTVEHLEAEGAPARPAGTPVNYQFFFRKYRVSVSGTITESSILPQGLVRTKSNLEYCPELVEIIDDYWYNNRANSAYVPLREAFAN